MKGRSLLFLFFTRSADALYLFYRQDYYYLYLGLIGSNSILTKLLSVERLKIFSDSVLLVAITILAYNLSPPSLINGTLSGAELQTFLDNVYGLISSFFVISIFWVLYTKLPDYVMETDDIVIVTSLQSHHFV